MPTSLTNTLYDAVISSGITFDSTTRTFSAQFEKPKPTNTGTAANAAIDSKSILTSGSLTFDAISNPNLDLFKTATAITPLPEKTTVILMPHENTVPMPESIMENEKKGMRCTTVKWSDGTYTTVKVSKDNAPDASPYMAFCCALAKKLYGTNSKVHRIVDRHQATYLGEQKMKAEAEKRKKQKENEERIERAKILAEAKRLRIKEAAKEYNRSHTICKHCAND